MARQYDLAQFNIDGKKHTAIIVQVRTGQGPDYVLMDGDGKLYERFSFTTELPGAIIDGKQHLDHDQAVIRAELEALARSKYGRQKIQAHRMRPKALDAYLPADSQHRENLDLFGGLPSYQEPWSLKRDANPQTVTQLDRFVAVRDPGADRETLSPDSFEVRYLDALKARNSRYYRVYVALVVERRKAADIAALEGTTVQGAFKLMQRARAAYLSAAKEAQA